jgi:hypothetical protein
VARDLVQEVADALNAPADYAGHTALVVAGASAGAAVELEIKPGWRERASFFAALVGPSGNSKSPSLRQVAAPVFEAQEARNAAHQQDGLEWADERRAWVDGGRQGEEPQRPVLARLIGSDLTMPALTPLLVQNPRGLLVIRDELRGWLQSLTEFSHGGSADRQRWLSIWAGEPIVVDRRGQPGPIMVPRPFVGVLGGMVPGALRSFAPPGGGARGAGAPVDDDGLLARFTFSFPDACRAEEFSTRSVRPQTAERWARALRRLRELEMPPRQDGILQPQVDCFTPEGQDAYADDYNEVAREISGPDFPGELRGAWLKFRSQIARLALTVHLLRWAAGAEPEEGRPRGVDAQSVEAAVRLAHYFRATFRRVVGVAADDDALQRAQAILLWLRRPRERHIGSFKAWEFLQQRHGAQFRRIKDVTPALDILARHNYLRVVSPVHGERRPGRPADPTFEVNPAVFSDS